VKLNIKFQDHDYKEVAEKQQIKQPSLCTVGIRITDLYQLK